MWEWLKSLWTDPAKFTGAMVTALGTVGTVVPSVAALNLPDFHVPGAWVAAGVVCNVVALAWGYQTTPRGK